MKTRLLTGVAMAALLAAAQPALADDPPARVGRLADLSGAVSLRTDPNQPWAVAARNQPVTSGMSFWTEPQARAELEIGPTELHLGDQSELDVRQLDDRAFAAQLDQGSVNLDIADMQSGETYTVDTPRGLVTLDRPGEYRIDAGTTQDPTQVVVFSGEAQIAGGPDGPVDIQGGETGIVSGSDPFSFTLARSADRSPLDDWADGHIRAAVTAPRYVSRAMTGYQDLDASGTWHETPAYGTVWYPTDVPADWVPYRYGRWAYDGRWGWTWVDDQPWGFAPFHYGRWAYVDDRWGWVPGPVEVHPVYAPALVTFFAGAAFGATITAAIDSHPIGWYPLGPGEIYRPSYRVSDTYVRNVNITNIRNIEINRITNIHNGPTIIENGANRRFATVVPAQVLASHAAVAHAALQVLPGQLDHAQLTPVSALPHPATLPTGAAPAPHPMPARGPDGRLPLVAADANRPHPPAPSEPTMPISHASGQPATQGSVQARQESAPEQPSHLPLPAPGQHGPTAPVATQAPGQPPAGPTGTPPLPLPRQHGPAAAPATHASAQTGQPPGRLPLLDRGQRPAGVTAPAITVRQPTKAPNRAVATGHPADPALMSPVTASHPPAAQPQRQVLARAPARQPPIRHAAAAPQPARRIIQPPVHVAAQAPHRSPPLAVHRAPPPSPQKRKPGDPFQN